MQCQHHGIKNVGTGVSDLRGTQIVVIGIAYIAAAFASLLTLVLGIKRGKSPTFQVTEYSE